MIKYGGKGQDMRDWARSEGHKVAEDVALLFRVGDLRLAKFRVLEFADAIRCAVAVTIRDGVPRSCLGEVQWPDAEEYYARLNAPRKKNPAEPVTEGGVVTGSKPLVDEVQHS